MTKHSASPFSHFALCAGLILSTSLSACTSDDWITQECVTLARSECPAQRESQCRFHDLLKLAADTKHPKQPRITPRYAKPSRKATSNKAVITPRYDFTGDAQNQIVTQAHTLQADTAEGFDFTGDAQNQKVAQAHTFQADTAEGFDFIENSTFANAHPSYAPAIQPNDIANTGCIDINTADIPELMRLPGIGQARAQAIVTSRETRAFKRKKDIRRIKGIGPKSYIKLAGLICDI
ncbi:MAG: helix-hairpin-helix domain-containing protein [Proteobacteria bacterium]|nr:helix-hairpin-helix domain-containing protein [Pseudomonadota bacterium]